MEWFQTYLFQTALTEWCGCMVYIMLSERKQRGIRLAGICLLMLAVQCLLVYVTSDQPESATFLSWLFFRILLYLAGMFLFLRLCCAGSSVGIAYLCLRFFLLAELAWSVYYEKALWRLMSSFSEESFFVLRWLLVPVVYGVVFGIMYLLEKYFQARMERFRITLHELCMVVIIAGITFLLSSFFASNDTTVLGGRVVLSHTLVDFLGIVFLFYYRLWFANLQSAQELEMIHRIAQQQTQQYDSAKESMEVVNRKYHDIRHVLTVMRSEVKQEQKLEWIDYMEQEIRDYEAWCETGNPVLDVVLSERYLRCVHAGIELVCVIDGSWLKEMEATDICTIFGNALDNAIRYVSRIPEREKRLIHVTVFEKQGCLNISVENVCEQDMQEKTDVWTVGRRRNEDGRRGNGKIRNEDGCRRAGKVRNEDNCRGAGKVWKEDGRRGAGKFRNMAGGGSGLKENEKELSCEIKSIQHIVSKYHGVMRADQEGNWFRLKLLFPVPLKA